MVKSLFFLLLTLCLLSCSDKATYTRTEMLHMAKNYDPHLELVIPKDLSSGVRCVTPGGGPYYGEGCVSAFTVKSGYLDFVILEFDSEKAAKNEAARLKQFYTRNWVFDDVSKEPLLEKFVKKAFRAKRAKNISQKESKTQVE